MIHIKCQYLTLSLANANYLKVKLIWLEFSQKFINTLSKLAIDFAKHTRTVTDWHIAFREKNNSPYQDKVDRLPPFLHHNENLIQLLKMYGNKKNLNYPLNYFTPLVAVQGDSSGRFSSNECFILAENIAQMVKKLKMYRCTLDFDRKFCIATILHSSNN